MHSTRFLCPVVVNCKAYQEGMNPIEQELISSVHHRPINYSECSVTQPPPGVLGSPLPKTSTHSQLGVQYQSSKVMSCSTTYNSPYQQILQLEPSTFQFQFYLSSTTMPILHSLNPAVLMINTSAAEYAHFIYQKGASLIRQEK